MSNSTSYKLKQEHAWELMGRSGLAEDWHLVSCAVLRTQYSKGSMHILQALIVTVQTTLRKKNGSWRLSSRWQGDRVRLHVGRPDSVYPVCCVLQSLTVTLTSLPLTLTTAGRA